MEDSRKEMDRGVNKLGRCEKKKRNEERRKKEQLMARATKLSEEDKLDR